MDSMEDKLGSILNNPQLMQQIMSMASTLSSIQEQPEPEPASLSLPEFDPVMIQKIMGLAGNLQVNDHQKNLLLALRPYLTQGRIEKLEKAMRAAKLANVASAALSSGALSFLTGR